MYYVRINNNPLFIEPIFIPEKTSFIQKVFLNSERTNRKNMIKKSKSETNPINELTLHSLSVHEDHEPTVNHEFQISKTNSRKSKNSFTYAPD